MNSLCHLCCNASLFPHRQPEPSPAAADVPSAWQLGGFCPWEQPGRPWSPAVCWKGGFEQPRANWSLSIPPGAALNKTQAPLSSSGWSCYITVEISGAFWGDFPCSMSGSCRGGVGMLRSLSSTARVWGWVWGWCRARGVPGAVPSTEEFKSLLWCAGQTLLEGAAVFPSPRQRHCWI